MSEFQCIMLYCRKIRIRDLDSWKKVERMCDSMRLFNILVMNWLYYFLGPIILGVCSGIVLMLYISVRQSGLPPMLHYCMLPLAFGTIMAVSWLWYDVVTMNREADVVIESLQSRSHRFLRDLEPSGRAHLFRKARALRSVHLTIGQFSDITLEGLVGIWDEVVNQLMFLLSL